MEHPAWNEYPVSLVRFSCHFAEPNDEAPLTLRLSIKPRYVQNTQSPK
ncbi:MAG: hypothetical protein QOF90_2653 [Acetobacteraceae bacterium]|jgi:hypothetical protein|nr:hypothetical protein [Acetobacteraceae bacterium]MEA2790698.1 hypothetical protein [Acetobacteraceae bacterium]